MTPNCKVNIWYHVQCINALLMVLIAGYQILLNAAYMINKYKSMNKQSSESVPQLSWRNIYGKWESKLKKLKDSSCCRLLLEYYLIQSGVILGDLSWEKSIKELKEFLCDQDLDVINFNSSTLQRCAMAYVNMWCASPALLLRPHCDLRNAY